MRRSFDVAVALFALGACSPLLLIAALGIKVTDPGPVLYRARRMGLDRRRESGDGIPPDGLERRHPDGYGGREFTMFKFRTMRVLPEQQSGPPITAANDTRIFPFGRFLRVTKIDELPQLWNVVRGEMAVVGPRPEAPEIVRKYYTSDDLLTLQVRPGVTSPGTIYYYTHCEHELSPDTVIDHYVQRLLPVKLALDRVYIKRASLMYDVRVLFRTAFGVAARLVFSTRSLPDPPELREVAAPRPQVLAATRIKPS